MLGALGERVRGQVGREVRLGRHRSDAGSPAAVRDRERLVQVQVRHVATEVAEAGETDECVHVRAVDVDLSARLVHGRADVDDIVLVHTVGRGVGDHERGERIGVRRDLRAQITKVDVARLVARDDDDAHAREHGRRRVRAVRRRRDEADLALQVAAVMVVPTDREQPRELALRAGVRLQRDRVVAGDLGEPRLELLDEHEVPRDVVGGRERVHARELRPRHGRHLGRRVELHRARAERDHAPVERIVAVGELLEVAHHRRLGVVRVEHGVRQELVLAPERFGQKPGQVLRPRARPEPERPLLRSAEHLRERVQLARRGGLIDRDADRVGVAEPQLESALARRLDDGAGTPRHEHDDRVEEVLAQHVVPGLDDPVAQQVRLAGDVGGDPAEAVGPVVDGVHGCHDGQQHLGGADVRGGLLAADVLLAGLQRQSVRGCARGIHRHTDETPGELPLEPRAHRHVAGMRSPEAERHTETLRRADGDVGAE